MPEPLEQGTEALTVLGQVDRLVRRAEDAVARMLELARELERRLSAELDDHSFRPLALADRQHLLNPEWLEVEPVGRVVVGRNGLRIAVDHHRFEPELAEGARRVDAAVVELDPLADPVRAGAEDDDGTAGLPHLVLLAPGGVEVVRTGLDLAGARVDAAVDGTDVAGAPVRAGGLLGGPARGGDVGVGDPQPLEPQPVVGDQVVEGAHARESAGDLLELGQKPWMDTLGHVLEPPPRRFCDGIELARAHRLQEGLEEATADAHRFPDRLHLRPERRVGAGKLLEGEAWELDDHVVERRLEAGRRRPCQVVRDLVQRVADGELRRDLRDRVAGRL